MSQPVPPRKFKFVGGPSRKRRRATVENNNVRLMRPASAEPNANANPKDKDGYVAPSDASCDGSTTSPPIPVAPSFTDETQLLPATVPPPCSEVLESLLDWSASASLPMAKDDLGSALTTNDPFPLFDFTFRLPTPSWLGPDNDAGPESPLYSSNELSRRFHASSAVGDMLSEISFNSTEDIERDISPELEDHRLIPGGITDKVDRLFAQCKATDTPVTPERESETQAADFDGVDNREFCVWPLTHDFEANPFRYDIETGRGSPVLWHSILALSYKHVHRETGACLTKAKAHKRKAKQLLKELEGDLGCSKSRADSLNGLLILITLDCATSAQGPWVAHLNRAQKIIETLEVFGIQKTPRIQAQIDMLVWWDVTLGLTTRRGFVLSSPTITSVLCPNSGSTFYNISGCPEELFKYMFRLGTYAREFELASHMMCVTFDMGPVLAVEKAIKEWRAPQFDDPDVGLDQLGCVGLPADFGLDLDPVQASHYVQDLYHCAQAWRFALLIYIERVFKWRRQEASMTRINFFARKALNNVMSCRRSVMIQKQLLLPTFLAACETDDENLREDAREYCTWWGGKTRYDMFITTLGLLEEVWAASADPDSWWGSLIDQKSGVGCTRQYLFG